MAGICTRFTDKVYPKFSEFVCDTVDEVAGLPTTTTCGTGAFAQYNYYAPLGSTCIVGNEGGDILVYMLFSFGWKQI